MNAKKFTTVRRMKSATLPLNRVGRLTREMCARIAHDNHCLRARGAEPRFKALYRAWKEDGEGALVSACSQALGDAVQAGAGRVETLELGHRYGHLSPLVAVA